MRAGIGLAPCDVLTQGVSKQSGLSFSAVTNLIGLAVLLPWIPIRPAPGLGTVLNVLLIGPRMRWFAPAPEVRPLPAQPAGSPEG